MFDFVNNSLLFREAKQAKLHFGLLMQLIVFMLVSFVTEFAAGLLPSFYATWKLLAEMLRSGNALNVDALQEVMDQKLVEMMTDETYILLTLFGTVFVAFLVPVYCRFIERRPLSSMGFRRGGLRHFAVGLVVGAVMFGATAGLCVLTQSATLSFAGTSAGTLLLFFAAFMVQGASEEILLRGYFTVSVSNATRPVGAVIYSSLMFAFLHFGNNGFGFIPFLNLFLFGFFMSLYFLKTNSIFGVCALHGVWNFAEGCLFGFPVSGLKVPSPLLDAVLAEGRDATNGGAFGPEGGAIVSIVLLLAIAILLYLPKKQTKLD